MLKKNSFENGQCLESGQILLERPLPNKKRLIFQLNYCCWRRKEPESLKSPVHQRTTSPLFLPVTATVKDISLAQTKESVKNEAFILLPHVWMALSRRAERKSTLNNRINTMFGATAKGIKWSGRSVASWSHGRPWRSNSNTFSEDSFWA